jgi:putative transposase
MAGRRRLITMARRRHTPEQIIRKLREADRLLGEGAEIAEVARHLEVSEQTYHRWRNQFGGMKADDARRLKDLERENRELKQIVADKELENRALREIAKDASEPVEATPCRGDAPGAARPLATAGVPDRRPAPLHSAPRARRAGPGSRTAETARTLRQEASPLGLPASARRALG